MKFLTRYHRALFVFGCAILTLTAMVFITGCGVPTFLTDLETIVPVAAGAVSGLLAILGGITGNAAETAAAEAINVIVAKIDDEFTELNSLIAEYKSNPNDTLLENIEAAVQEVTSDLSNILTIAGLPTNVATTIQNVVQAVLTQLNALLSIIPVFKSSTAGASLAVVKPIAAADFKKQINTALAKK